jgi:hypothetical protein
MEIRDEIRTGTFRFRKLRMAPVPKRFGGHRIISVPTVRDRLLQRALLRHLEGDPRFPVVSSICYGFAKGKTLADAQRRALELRLKSPWVLQADIVKFFDQIRRPDIKKLIKKAVRSKIVVELLCAAVDCELDEGGASNAQMALENGIEKGRGLRQGMPVSPLLSNLLLKAFDDAIGSQGIEAIRYADDIAVFASSRNECRDALAFIKDKLKELDLNIPDIQEGGKTTISDPTDAVDFLGIEIKRTGETYKLAAPNRKIEKIEADMAAIASVERCVAEKRNIGQVVRLLDSFIIGHSASMAVLNDSGQFLSRLEASKQRKLRSFMVEVIGNDAVKALDQGRLAILGLQLFKD